MMLYPVSILGLLLLALIHLTSGSSQHSHHKPIRPFHSDPSHFHHLYPPVPSHEDKIPSSTRSFWIRRANAVLPELSSPCPFAPFGTVIVNHTATSNSPHGEEICIGINKHDTGNPVLHGEISAILNCTSVLQDPMGLYKFSAAATLEAFKDLTLYTNAEPCPMCASAIRWAGFKECVFGVSIEELVAKGWKQISIPSEEVFEEAEALGSETRLIGGVGRKETEVLFSWQFNGSAECPDGCGRMDNGRCGESGRGKIEL